MELPLHKPYTYNLHNLRVWGFLHFRYLNIFSWNSVTSDHPTKSNLNLDLRLVNDAGKKKEKIFSQMVVKNGDLPWYKV